MRLRSVVSVSALLAAFVVPSQIPFTQHRLDQPRRGCRRRARHVLDQPRDHPWRATRRDRRSLRGVRRLHPALEQPRSESPAVLGRRTAAHQTPAAGSRPSQSQLRRSARTTPGTRSPSGSASIASACQKARGIRTSRAFGDRASVGPSGSRTEVSSKSPRQGHCRSATCCRFLPGAESNLVARKPVKLVNGVQIPVDPTRCTRFAIPTTASARRTRSTFCSAASPSFRRAITGFDREVTIWDMSLEHGGHYGPHRSHRSGRDVDIGLPLRAGY